MFSLYFPLPGAPCPVNEAGFGYDVVRRRVRLCDSVVFVPVKSRCALSVLLQVKNLDTGEEHDISDNEGGVDGDSDPDRRSTVDEEQALLKSIASAFFDLAPKTIKVI